MTANSDYGVSIVESFVPPQNMIPGQSVNKDVYAVNTGSIDAFVKESISGVLNYTYEGVVSTWTENCLELNKAQIAAIEGISEEAGGFLAWTDADYATGPINSNAATDDWNPPATGIYIFRRAINTTEDGATFDNPKFTYAGYYFVKGAEDDPETTEVDESTEDKYYKIVIGDDTYRADESQREEDGSKRFIFDIYADSATVTAAGATAIAKDGTITADDIAVQYVVETTITNAVPLLTYHEATEDAPAYLDAVYSTSLAEMTDDLENAQADLENAQADLENAQAAKATAETARDLTTTNLAQKEIDYQDALGAYNSALSRYRQTKADYDYAKALKDATNALIDAADARKDVEVAKDAAATALQGAATTLKGEASDIITDNAWIAGLQGGTTLTNNGASGLINTEARNRITAYNANHSGALDNVLANIALFDAKYAEIEGYADTLKDALDELAAIETGDPNEHFDDYTTSTRVNELQGIINTAKANLETTLDEYAALYANIVRATTAEANLTGLDWGSATTISDFITNSFDGLDLTDLNTDADAYETAYDAYEDYVEDGGLIDQADEAWETAVNTYNETVAGAYADYHEVIDELQPVPNFYVGYDSTTELSTATALHDNGATLVPYNGTANTAGYSANFNGDDPATSDTTETASPKIAEDVSWKVYTTNATYSTKPNSGSVIVKQTVADEADFAQLAASINPAASNGNLGVLATALGTAETALGTARTNYEDAQDAYDTAQEAVDAAQDDIDAANAAITAANTAINEANNALAAAAVPRQSTIAFKIVLAENLGWTSELDDNESDYNAAFYLNKILTAGETSDKLIDYVEFYDTVTANDYKDLTFDLNVGLDSIQVAYDANQRGYTDETVTADTAFTMTPTIETPLVQGSDVSWS